MKEHCWSDSFWAYLVTWTNRPPGTDGTHPVSSEGGRDFCGVHEWDSKAKSGLYNNLKYLMSRKVTFLIFLMFGKVFETTQKVSIKIMTDIFWDATEHIVCMFSWKFWYWWCGNGCFLSRSIMGRGSCRADSCISKSLGTCSSPSSKPMCRFIKCNRHNPEPWHPPRGASSICQILCGLPGRCGQLFVHFSTILHWEGVADHWG